MAIINYAVEQFRRDATVSETELRYEIGYHAWREDDGAVIESSVDQILALIPYEIGDEFPGKPGLKAREFRPTCHDEADVWNVVVLFEIPPVEPIPDDFDEFMQQSNGAGADDPNNPFGPKFSGGGQVIEVYSPYDLENKPFLNSAGDVLEGIPSIPVNIQVDRVEVNERTKPNTANQGKCQGKKLLAAVGYQSQEHVDKRSGIRTRYYTNTYEVWTHPYQDWKDVKLIDRGYREKTDLKNPRGQVVGFELVTIKDQDTGDPVNEAVPLNGQGKRLPAGQPPVPLTFRIREEGPLNVPFMNI